MQAPLLEHSTSASWRLKNSLFSCPSQNLLNIGRYVPNISSGKYNTSQLNTLIYTVLGFNTYYDSALSIGRNLSNLYPFERPMHVANYPTAIRFLLHVNTLLASLQAGTDPNCNVAHNCKPHIFLYSCYPRYILPCL